MTPVIDHLRAIGRDTTAADIARALGMRREDVYLELVPAEARGEARIVSTCPEQNGRRVMLWGAL